MLGLFATLDLGKRSLQTQQQGVEVAGHNIANVNTPGYARQRLVIQTSPAIDTPYGPQGTGADAAGIVQLRSAFLDQQIQGETSVTGYLQTLQNALEDAQSGLGQTINTQASGSAGSSSQNSLAAALSDLFNAFQSLSNDPSSLTQRQVLLQKAADLASRFNLTDQRLGSLQSQLTTSVQTDTASANDLLAQIAKLNGQISQLESNSSSTANDLRDLRQQKIEALSKLVKIDVATDSSGAMDISIAGTTFVSGRQLLDSLQTYDAGSGQILVRAQTAGTPLTLTGGSIAGAIDARDGQVASLRANLNSLASALITEVNTVHRAGYNLNGGTGADFFSGTGAADIQVNSALAANPALLQASGVTGAAGDNQVALALAQLADTSVSGLNHQTFNQSYNQTVAALGQSLASVNTQMDDQNTVSTMLSNQRDSVSGVSLDEEMTDLIKYQKAFQGSARLVSIVDQMLDTILNMKQ
jgi:flagellar hook-associated protein 1 FlgK